MLFNIFVLYFNLISLHNDSDFKPVADPGFPMVGAPTPKGCQHGIFSEILCVKTKETGP